MKQCQTASIGLVIFLIVTLSLFPTIIGLCKTSDSYSEDFTYNPGDWNGVYWFINAYDITPVTTGSWVTVNITSYVPAGFNASGAVLDIHNTSPTTQYKVAVRKPTSTDDFYDNGKIYASNSTGTPVKTQRGLDIVGVNSSYCFQAKIEDTTIKIYLIGITDQSVVFFTNAIDKSTGTTSSWVTVDVSSNVSSTATGVFVMLININSLTGYGTIRAGGSTDSRTGCIEILKNGYIRMGVGLNSSKQFQQYITDTEVDLYIIAYTKSAFTWNTNARDVSLASTGSWEDIKGNKTGVIIEIENTNGLNTYKGEIRNKGSTDDRTASATLLGPHHIGHACGCNSTEYFEGYIENTGVDFFLMGFTNDINENTTLALSETQNVINLITVNNVTWTNYNASGSHVQINNLYENSNITIDYTVYVSSDIVNALLPLSPMFYIIGVVVVSIIWILELPKICSGGKIE